MFGYIIKLSEAQLAALQHGEIVQHASGVEIAPMDELLIEHLRTGGAIHDPRLDGTIDGEGRVSIVGPGHGRIAEDWQGHDWREALTTHSAAYAAMRTHA